MGVLAYKIITGTPDYTVERDWNCGNFDLLQESQPGNGWIEISRDCDAWPQSRRTLNPYASGNNGKGGASPPAQSGPRWRKYFPELGDVEASSLDFSDVNSGYLPTSMCGNFDLFQNGKKLPCEAFTVDYPTSIVTIVSAWRVPGASYEAIYDGPTIAP